MSFEFDLVR